MPGSGGRLGPKAPTPAATITTNRATVSDATDAAALWDSNGTAASFSATSTTVLTGNNYTITAELLPFGRGVTSGVVGNLAASDLVVAFAPGVHPREAYTELCRVLGQLSIFAPDSRTTRDHSVACAAI